MNKQYKKARICPYCTAKSRVYDSREDAYGRIVRWRECPYCFTRFKTIENFVGFVEMHHEKKKQEEHK